MKRSVYFMLPLLALIIGVTSCKKGDTGPAGATGPAGPTGATGATGTANVIYSPWAPLAFTGSGASYSARITAPGVTQDIMDKGVVKTYFKFGTAVYEGTYHNQSTNSGIYQYLTVGFINLVANFDASYPWRYVIIPGGIAGGRVASGAEELFQLQDGTTIPKSTLDKMSYAEICQRFNIPQ